MSLSFNTAGPIDANRHYHIDPLSRLDWPEVAWLIDQHHYFQLRAPRQSGKTSTLLAMVDTINKQGDYQAVYANIEAAQVTKDDYQTGINMVCQSIARQAKDNKITSLLQDIYQQINETGSDEALAVLLSQWAQQNPKPCVLFLDEVDALVGSTLIALLRQIRAGYAQRPHAFPLSIVLCGVRDVKDYRIVQGNDIITGGSAFNIKVESIRLADFNNQQMRELFNQHSQQTGQVLDEQIFTHLWADTQGQPWLVNALGWQMLFKNKANRDTNKTITCEDYFQAREALIYARTTHLDQLADKLKEPRVRKVISPMLTGVSDTPLNPHDVEYVIDLGLIRQADNLAISIANNIYQEVIPRELSLNSQLAMTEEQAWYLTDQRIDMNKLMGAFQQFFRENADIWIEKFDYKEAAPQLIMQAFLQRIVNGGARITREYALGRARIDLLIEWPLTDNGFQGQLQRIVIELKIRHQGLQSTINKGIEQTKGYAQQVGADEAHLVIFERDSNIDWNEKIWHKTIANINVWGC